MNHRSLLLAVVLLAACSEAKPTFDTPSVVFSAPSVSSVSSTASIASVPTASSKQAVPVSATPVNPSSNPPSVLIEVPFAPQAPSANWDALHEEACEEMSLIMVQHYLDGTSLSLTDAETEVQALVAWERSKGYADDVTASEIADIAEAKYGSKARVLTNVTAAELRKELAAGHPIIMPAAGQLLGNPYFSGDGPPYHMLVIVGYDAKGFITNDPGTKRGKQYWYATDVLMNALHDWTGDKATMSTGAKTVVVIDS